MLRFFSRVLGLGVLTLSLCACDDTSINSPQAKVVADQKVRYTSFVEPMLTLDPAKAYTVSAHMITGQIYEPPLQYHYLKRPYVLKPLTVKTVPQPKYLDQWHQILPVNAKRDEIVYTVYDFFIKPGIHYAPHPAFARDGGGRYWYHHLKAGDLRGVAELQDFQHFATRELTAEDYAYEIKRLASPETNSPIFGVMAQYIVGFSELRSRLKASLSGGRGTFLDLRKFDLDGVKVIDRYHYQVIIKGVYNQFIYWFAMPFFAPIPWEADLFYSQPGMRVRNLSLDWMPVGTGPYQLSENNPSQRMVLAKNSNFHDETFPTQGAAGDAERGFLRLGGEQLPFIDKLMISLEKESIPRWAKFLQGYYDASSLSSDSFDQAIEINRRGEAALTAEMKAQGIRLEVTVEPGFFYLGFNWLDPIVGGDSERSGKLRRAIAIAVDFDEYIQIFLNGRGKRGQGPIPPGIFGYSDHGEGINSMIFRDQGGVLKRRDLAEAKSLLAQAGYSDGVDPKTGKPLRLVFDVAATGPTASSYLAWMRKQFQKIGIDLQVRNTQYNRFQKKIRKGNSQIFMWGWVADYPDPENFLFLFYGPNGKKQFGGENVTNYHNQAYDDLFDQMKNLPDGPERLQLINKMLALLYRDMPSIVAYYPIAFNLVHQWSVPAKPIALSGNFLKYLDLDPQQREQAQQQWNKPRYGLLWGLLSLLIGALVAMGVVAWRRAHRVMVQRYDEEGE